MKPTIISKKTSNLWSGTILFLALCCLPYLNYGQSTTVTIGSLGTTSEYDIPVRSLLVPVSTPFNEYSYGTALYPKSALEDLDIPLGSTINSIAFWMNAQGQQVFANNVFEIWLGNSTDSDLSSATPFWSAQLASATQVYSGILPLEFSTTFGNQSAGFVEISTFNNFTYSGNGILLGTSNETPGFNLQTWFINPIFGQENNLGGQFAMGAVSGGFVFPNLMTNLTSGTRPHIQLTFTPCINESEINLTTTSPSACIGETVTLQASTGTGSIVWYADALGNSQLASGNSYTTGSISSN
ncbi:MAG: hypothetical protein AAF598_10590, partial [Bacteroidota bacterium]